jgi:hypothetical protein
MKDNNWEKEFSIFYNEYNADKGGALFPNQNETSIKSFISQKLKEQRERIIEEIEKEFETTIEQSYKNSYRCEVCGLEYQYYHQCPVCLRTSNITPDLTVNKRKHYPPILDIVDTQEQKFGKPFMQTWIESQRDNHISILETSKWLERWRLKNKIRHYQRELNKIK